MTSPELPEPLTQRELTILSLLATSMSNSEIADELCLSVNTIKTHLAAIYRKLPASRRREAVSRARQLELILVTGISPTFTRHACSQRGYPLARIAGNSQAP